MNWAQVKLKNCSAVQTTNVIVYLLDLRLLLDKENSVALFLIRKYFQYS